MELKLINGNYVADDSGGFVTVADEEELLQRVLFKLTAHRGGFPLLPELGSRLYLLQKEKRQNRESMARQYIMEALKEEPDLTLEDLEIQERDGDIALTAFFRYGEESLSLTLTV